MVASSRVASVTAAKAGSARMPRRLNLGPANGPVGPPSRSAAVAAHRAAESEGDASPVHEMGEHTDIDGDDSPNGATHGTIGRPETDIDCNELCEEMARHILSKGAKRSPDREWMQWLNELHIALHVNGQSRIIAGKGGQRTLPVRWLTHTKSS
jgi:hypothetical protein